MKRHGIGWNISLWKKSMDKIEFLVKLANGHATPNGADLTICKAVIDTLSAEERERVLSYNTELGDYILWRFNAVQPKPAKHMKAWTSYFKDLKQRKHGQYSKSRSCLYAMLPHIEWTGQLTVLRFLVQSSIKSEQSWAAAFLISHWEIIADLPKRQQDNWYDMLINAWLLSCNEKYACLIVKCFPLRYIEQNATELIAQYDYFHTAVRLAENPTYEVDQTRLTDRQYLYVMAKAKRFVTDELCQQVLAELLLSKSTLSAHEIAAFWANKEKYAYSLLSLDEIRKQIWSLGKLGKSNLLIHFYQFDELVQKQLSHRFEHSDRWEVQQHLEGELCHLIRCYTPVLQIERKIVRRIIDENPAIARLVKELKLTDFERSNMVKRKGVGY